MLDILIKDIIMIMRKKKNSILQIRPYISTDFKSLNEIYIENELFEEEIDGEKVINLNSNGIQNQYLLRLRIMK